MLSECSACHANQTPRTIDGGPHGLHPLGDVWVEDHAEAAEDGGSEACRACHGVDYRGTELSRAQADRVLETDFGTKRLWRGFQVGCYLCHLGPSGEEHNPNRSPHAEDIELASRGRPVALVLRATDLDGDTLSFRIVSQPAHGTIGLSGSAATYFPEAGYAGDDAFTFASWDGSTQSNLGRVTVAVVPRPCPGDCDEDGIVTLAEVVTGVGIALARAPLSRCPLIDTNEDGSAAVTELIEAVNAELIECAAGSRGLSGALGAPIRSSPPA